MCHWNSINDGKRDFIMIWRSSQSGYLLKLPFTQHINSGSSPKVQTLWLYLYPQHYLIYLRSRLRGEEIETELLPDN